MSTSPPPLGSMTNLGIRAPDLEAEIEFLVALGGSTPQRSRLLIGDRVQERVFIDFHGTRFGLFQRASYDDRLEALSQVRGGGLSHVSFQSADAEMALRHAAAAGIAALMGPYDVNTVEGGTGRVVYFRSPNGTVVQAQQRLT
jgi:hypothetical protein